MYVVLSSQSHRHIMESSVVRAFMDNKPIFEDEYMFDKVDKQFELKKINNVPLYFIDQDNNNEYNNVRFDYYGLKMDIEKNPTVEMICDTCRFLLFRL